MVICTWNYLHQLHVNVLLYQLPLNKLQSLIENTIHLIITNGFISCIIRLCTFGFLSQKSFYYFNFIWFVIFLFKVIPPVLVLLYEYWSNVYNSVPSKWERLKERGWNLTNQLNAMSFGMWGWLIYTFFNEQSELEN